MSVTSLVARSDRSGVPWPVRPRWPLALDGDDNLRAVADELLLGVDAVLRPRLRARSRGDVLEKLPTEFLRGPATKLPRFIAILRASLPGVLGVVREDRAAGDVGATIPRLLPPGDAGSSEEDFALSALSLFSGASVTTSVGSSSSASSLSMLRQCFQSTSRATTKPTPSKQKRTTTTPSTTPVEAWVSYGLLVGTTGGSAVGPPLKTSNTVAVSLSITRPTTGTLTEALVTENCGRLAATNASLMLARITPLIAVISEATTNATSFFSKANVTS